MGAQNTPAEPTEPDLTPDEARALVDELIHDGQAQAIRLRALRNRKGYTALGYLTWQVCCEELIGISVRAADYQIGSHEEGEDPETQVHAAARS